MKLVLIDNDFSEFELLQAGAQSLASPIQFSFIEDSEQMIENLLRLSSDGIPDAILLDINMPRVDGFECLDQLKRYEKFQNVPILMYSTSSSETTIMTAYEKGADFYLTKPHSFEMTKGLIKILSNMDWQQVRNKNKDLKSFRLNT